MSLLRSLTHGSALATVLFLCPMLAQAEGVEPYEEYAQHLRAGQQVTPLTSSEFGDQISLYNAATEFDVTDIDVPGNNALPVRLGRRFEIADWHGKSGHVSGFGEWDMDVPYLEGVFLADMGWTNPNGSGRCTSPSAPNTSSPTYGQIDTDLVWDGYQMYMPGGGSQELLVNTQTTILPQDTDGKAYPWITKNYTRVTCLPTTSNGYPGEAFVAVSPDGVRTTFDYVVVKNSPSITWSIGYTTNGQQIQTKAPRVKIFMLATSQVDRFGNSVTYSYGTDGAGNTILNGITSSDGRYITPSFTNGVMTSATSSVGNWGYGYITDPNSNYPNQLSLHTVLRPDGSQWTYTATGTLNSYKEPPDDSGPPRFTCQIDHDQNTGTFGYTVSAPFGAVANYQFTLDRHYRNYVPYGCLRDENQYHLYPALVYDFIDNFSIHSKQITGPALSTQTWTYSEDSAETYNYYYVTSVPGPENQASQTYVPPADCPNCSLSKVVTVAGPTHVDKYTFGTQYARNEGRLLGTETDDLKGNVLKTITNTFVADSEVGGTGLPFPNYVGSNLAANWKNPMTAWIRPQRQAATVQDGVTFTHNTNAWDVFANPVSVTDSSTLGFSKTESTAYVHNLTKWVIGQVDSVADPASSSLVVQNFYDPNTAMLTSTKSFGLLQKSLTYNADGTLKTVADGDGNTTTLSNFTRGVPQLVAFADGTSETAVVNGAGWITSLTSPIGATPTDKTTIATTLYGYDPMGRVNLVTYPTGDSVAWTPTASTFAQVNAAEFGIPAGHWKQTLSTGNATKVTYFDALLRPLLNREYDAATPSTTTRFTAKTYDADGHTTFGSYAVATIGNYNDPINGVHSTYDGLGRPLASTQDSERGALTTNYAYLSGFITEVVNPRRYATLTSYQAFGSPDTNHPVSIASPLSVTTNITRDVFGKPLALTRNGTWGSTQISETRNYVYDANQRLCKRVEPETGATLMNYDGANNVLWAASGSTLTSTGSCDNGSAPANAVVHTYDLRNRPLTETVPGSTNIGYSYYNDGELKTLTSGANFWTYSYNKRRLPLTEQFAIDTRNQTITHGYDALGHEKSLTYPSGMVITTVPNALGQATKVGSPGGFATGISYFPNGGISGFTYGNGIVHTLTQNTRELPLRSVDQLPGANAILDDTYAYDENANVSGIADGTPGNVNSRTMAYDHLDRLTGTSAPGQPWITASTTYDGLDNIRNNTVGTRSGTYIYDANWHLSQITGGLGYTFGYDANGNVTTGGNGKDSYAFDIANRLQSVTGKESYAYDGYGRRVKITRISDGKIDYPVYTMSGQLLTEDDQRSGKSTDYISLDGSLLAKRSGPIGTGTYATTYEHTDALRSPITETNSTAVTGHIERYTPYGEPSDGTYTQGPGFTGHVTDAATGLTYAQQRYYDPILGRFLSVDPVMASDNGGSFNRYAYAVDNPYRYSDPDGRCPKGSTADTCVVSTAAKNPSGKDVKLSDKNSSYVTSSSVRNRVASGGQSEEQAVAVVSKDGKPGMAQLSNVSKTHDDEKGDSASGTKPEGTEAIVHGHVNNSMVDQLPVGDSKIPMKNDVPNVTVSGDANRVGVHEVEGGVLQFRMLRGTMTTDEQTQIQGNLNSAQEVYSQQK